MFFCNSVDRNVVERRYPHRINGKAVRLTLQQYLICYFLETHISEPFVMLGRGKRIRTSISGSKVLRPAIGRYPCFGGGGGNRTPVLTQSPRILLLQASLSPRFTGVAGLSRLIPSAERMRLHSKCCVRFLCCGALHPSRHRRRTVGIRRCPVDPRTRLGTAYRRTRGLTQPVRTRCQFVGWSVKGRSPRLPADPYLPHQSIPFAPSLLS